jgi:HD-GYP domain-containing protein (c-di-GMP phosphodiesterase class II)
MRQRQPSTSVKANPPKAAPPKRLGQGLAQVWVPVRAKITLPFLLIALAMAVVIAFIVYQILFENLDARFNNQLVENGKLASSWMVEEEDARLDTLRLLAFTQGVGDALHDRNADYLRQLTWGTVLAKQEDDVEFLDAHGNLVLSMRHRAESLYLEDYEFAKGGDTDYRQWSFVSQVISQQSDGQGDKFSGLARAIWGDTFFVSGPVYDSTGKFAGVALVGESMTDLVRKMRRDLGPQVTIYTVAGQPIASTFSPPMALNTSQVLATVAKQSEISLRRDGDSRRSLTYAGIDYGEILGPWILRSHQEAGLIGTAIPKNLLLQASDSVRIQLAMLIGVGLFVVLVCGRMVANWITTPILGLVTASREVTQGNLDVQVSPQYNDEVAVLTENFNSMIASLQTSRDDLLKAYNTTLEGLSKAADLRDGETVQHTERITQLTLRLAKVMGISKEVELTNLYRGALLHDIGNLGIPDAILRKSGKLTEEEFAQIRKHPVIAHQLLAPIEYLRPALDIPYCHHEKWDGSGYPQGLVGEQIPLAARLFAVVDVWDAMTSDRAYRKAWPEWEALRHIAANRGTHFDPLVVDAFLSILSGK